MKVKIYDLSKTKANTTNSVELSDKVFNARANDKVVLQAIQAQLANQRKVIANTKDRSEVSGGGRKPYRQKGTGQARAGSNRSPIWIGGGVTFGPTRKRNFQKKLPKKVLNLAIQSIIGNKIQQKKLIIVSELILPKIATKKVQDILENMPLEEGKILLIMSKTNVNLELSVANLPYIKAIQVGNINVLDLLKYDYIVTDTETIKIIEKLYKEEK